MSRATGGDSPRERILTAAAELLVESPDGVITTRAVCARADVTAPTLYHHFGDKEGLLDAVVTHGFERYLETKRTTERGDDPIDDLRRGWQAHVDFGLAHPAFYTLMYGHPQRRRTPPAAVEARMSLLVILNDARAAGRITVEPELAADIVLAANVGATLTLIAARETSADRRLADHLLQAVIELLT